MKSVGIFLQSARCILCSVAVFFGLFSTALAQTTWNSVSDGVWTNDAAWTAGVPNANTANLISNTASYTVTVDATPATFYGSLNITNATGRTTRLNVNAPGFTSTNGALTFGRGSEVYVNSGGVMSYTGRTSATPFVTVRDGGVWRLEGGRVDFASLRRATPTSGSSSVYVGLDSTGRLEIASGDVVLAGVWESAETNNSVSLRIGQGTAGYGSLVMTGGKLTTWNFDGTSAMIVGSGSRSVGVVDLSGSALLLASNAVNIGSGSATGSVTVAGNAVFKTKPGVRPNMGYDAYAMGTVTTRENGFLDFSNSDQFYMGQGYNSKAVLNVAGGRVAVSGIVMCRSGTSTGGSAEINLSAGVLGGFGAGNGYAITMAWAQNTTGNAKARLNISGGLLDLSAALWNFDWYQGGIVAGKVGTAANLGAAAVGEVWITGGTVTNSGQFILGGGPGATGTVVQTSGDVRQGMGSPSAQSFLTVGWGGGWGSYTFSGGTFISARNVYIGGLTVSDLAYTPTDVAFTSNSAGTLRVDGGSFAVTNANLYLGRYGTGTLILGSNGVCSAKDVVLSSNTQSNVRFEFGANGAGTLTALGALTISDGAKLEVDSTAYRGSASWIKLIDCATRTNSFAQANITVTGKGIVRQDRDEDVWLFIRRSAIFVN